MIRRIRTHTAICVVLVLLVAASCDGHATTSASSTASTSNPSVTHSSSVTSGVPANAAATPSCRHRYFLYSVQLGEGISLRRDVFLRMLVSLLQSATGSRAPSAQAAAAFPENDNNGTDTATAAAATSPINWTLVLPAWSRRVSPHWGIGIPHPSSYYEDGVAWRTVFDIDWLQNQTGIRMIEWEEFKREMNEQSGTSTDGSKSAPGSSVPSSTASQDPSIPFLSSLLHLCNFHFTPDFFARQQAAVKEGRTYPLGMRGGVAGRSETFRDFACMNGEVPEEKVGFCSNPIPTPVELHERTRQSENKQQLWGIELPEYEMMQLQHGKDSVHCGVSNIMPHALGPLLLEYMSPSKPSSPPSCVSALNNGQLVYWPPRHSHDMAAEMKKNAPEITTDLRDHIMRNFRLAPLLLELAHTFIRHMLHAQPALPSGSGASLLPLSAQHRSSSNGTTTDPPPSPGYISFHVRRGDFLRVHSDVVPDLAALANQIYQRFCHVWKIIQTKREGKDEIEMDQTPSQDAQGARRRRPPARPSKPTLPLPSTVSTRVVISSDMAPNEFNQLQTELNRIQNDASMLATIPRIELIRFDLTKVRQQLQHVASPPLLQYLDECESAARAHASRFTGDIHNIVYPLPTHTPLTPLHVLAVDSYIMEQSVSSIGFVGTSHSYVSEMVWQQRKAMNLEPYAKYEKDALAGPGPGADNKKDSDGADGENHDRINAKDEL